MKLLIVNNVRMKALSLQVSQSYSVQWNFSINSRNSI